MKMRAWLAKAFAVLVVSSGLVTGSDSLNTTAIIEGFFSNGYNKRISPNHGKSGTTVSITMYVLSMDHASDKSMDFNMRAYFRQYWLDPRLKYDVDDSGHPDKIMLTKETMDRLWNPDTFFINEKSVTVQAGRFFGRVTPDGKVLKSELSSITAVCNMDLSYFPFDHQICPLEMESYSYTATDIRYAWKEESNSVGLSSDLYLPNFEVIGHRVKTIEAMLLSGNYSRLLYEVLLRRKTGRYLQQTYLPSASVVVLSWLGLFLGPEASTERITFGLGCVLIMFLVAMAAGLSMPHIHAMTAMDQYLGFCTFMVFAVLLESSIVTNLGRFLQRRRSQLSQSEGHNEGDTALMVEDNANLLDKVVFGRFRLGHLDFYSKIAFPSLFLLYNLIYWPYYLTGSDQDLYGIVEHQAIY